MRKTQAHKQTIRPGKRMKGGVMFDSLSNGYRAVVHSWDNEICEGEPEEWTSEELFSTEDEAMAFYKNTIQPSLKNLLREFADKSKGGTFIHRNVE